MSDQTKKPPKISSFEPVIIKDWVLCVSIEKETDGVCIIMLHRYEHTLRCAYVIGKEETAKFIENTIERSK